jgi:8-oxo-dGTP pyrophosphatase MutT (NUDIX family)
VNRLILDMIQRRVVRPTLFAWWRLTRGATLGVRIAVYDTEGRVLLVRHSYVPGWYFPGGGVDAGETAEAAAIRELREETGHAAREAPRFLGFFHNPRSHRSDHVAFFELTAFEKVAEAPLGREIAEVAFHPLDALPKDTTPSTRARIAERGQGGPVAGVW